MKVVATTDEYTIYQRRDERYAVKDRSKQPINGEAKVAILLQHELIKPPSAKVAAAPQDDAPAPSEGAEPGEANEAKEANEESAKE